MSNVTLQYTPIHDIPKMRQELFASFATRKSHPLAYRKVQLLQFAFMIQDNLEPFQRALFADLGRPPLEATFLELGQMISDALTAYKKVDSWAKPDGVPFDIKTFLMRPHVRKVPKGVVLIIGPFNYPLWSMLGPMVSAIAAGCAVLLKPSELTPAVSSLIAELIPKYLDGSMYKVVNGGVDEATKVLELQWDQITFTGSQTVGRIVATAAAKHLTPTTLELGGKCPVIIDTTADLDLAAKRILWAKHINAGQTCMAPDYILVPEEMQDKLVEALKRTYAVFYPSTPKSDGNVTANANGTTASTANANENGASPETSNGRGNGAYPDDSQARIISPSHFSRLVNLLSSTKGKTVLGGHARKEDKFIATTVVRDVGEGDSLMSMEIFGPVLPIVPIKDIESAIQFVNARDHPLVLYIFTTDTKVRDRVFDRTQSGACLANDLVIHGGFDGIPFGGVGKSGYGTLRAQYGFNTFTHMRGAADVPKIAELVLGARYPPYTAKKKHILDKLTVPKIPYPRPNPSAGALSKSLISNGKKRWGIAALFSVIFALLALFRGRFSFRGN